MRLAQNYNSSLPSQPFAGGAAGFGEALAAASSSVPEPAGATLWTGAVMVVGLARRGRPRGRGQAS